MEPSLEYKQGVLEKKHKERFASWLFNKVNCLSIILLTNCVFQKFNVAEY